MSEVLLQSIVEKLESIEISILKDNNSVKEETVQVLLKEIISLAIRPFIIFIQKEIFFTSLQAWVLL